MAIAVKLTVIVFNALAARTDGEGVASSEYPMRKSKTVAESATEQVWVINPPHLNMYGSLFGGQLASWVDDFAGVVATRHCNASVTTVAIEELLFLGTVTAKEVVVMRGRVVYVGTSSLEMRIDSYAEYHSGERRLISTALVVMVAVGDDGRPIEVPALKLVTDQERQEFEEGRQRSERRKIEMKKYRLG